MPNSNIYSSGKQSGSGGQSLPLIYAQVREDTEVDVEALAISETDNVLTITSGGCSALRFLAESPDSVTALDFNRTQNHLLELKREAVRHLDLESCRQFLGAAPCEGYQREAIFTNLLHGLSDQAAQYWLTHLNAIEAGVLNSGRTEFFSTLTAIIIRYITHYPSVYRDIMAINSLEEQQAYYEQRFNTLRWRLFLRACLNRLSLAVIYGKGFSKYLAQDETLSAHIQGKIRHAFYTTLLKDNPLITRLLFGRYASGAPFPSYLTEPLFASIRQNLTRLNIISDNLLTFIADPENQGKYQKVSLSNAVECFPEQELPAFFRHLADFLPESGVVVSRSMMGSRQYPLPESLTVNQAASARFTAQERACMYSQVYVLQKASSSR